MFGSSIRSQDHTPCLLSKRMESMHKGFNGNCNHFDQFFHCAVTHVQTSRLCSMAAAALSGCQKVACVCSLNWQPLQQQFFFSYDIFSSWPTKLYQQ